MSGASYWQLEAGWRDRYADTEVPSTIDVAVIGGGFAGLATAIHVKERSPSTTVVVFEAERVGFGASGRNAGFLSPLAAPIWLVDHAPRAAEINHRMHEAARWIRERAPRAELAAARLGLVADGWLAERALAEFARAVDRTGLDHAYERGRLAMPAYTLHPYRLIEGLAEHATRIGVAIKERMRVTTIDGRIVTDSVRRDSIDARQVVICTNAYTTERVRARAFESSMVATDRLTLDRDTDRSTLDRSSAVDRSVRNDRTRSIDDFIVDVNLVQSYHRMHDGRLIYGADRGDLAKQVGKLGARVQHAWSGPLHATINGLPIIERRGHAIVNVGYGGTGVALTLALAPLVADVVLGGAPPLIDTIATTRISPLTAARTLGRIIMQV